MTGQREHGSKARIRCQTGPLSRRAFLAGTAAAGILSVGTAETTTFGSEPPQGLSKNQAGDLRSAVSAGSETRAERDAPIQGAGPAAAPVRSNRIAVSTYSYWRFQEDKKLPIETCIDLAADQGFDGVEILHMQMEREDRGYLQNLKRRAFVNGLDLCGFSTHQTFVSPDPAVRRRTSTTPCIASNWPTRWVSRRCA